MKQKSGRKPKTKWQKIGILLFILFFLLGVGLISYPFLSRLYFERQAEDKAASYGTFVHDLSGGRKEEIEEEIKDYNERLGSREQEDAMETVSASFPEGTLGTLWIPSADIYVPVYLTMKTRELGQGACHVVGTSLPTSEANTNCMIIGHSGLSYMQIFDRMRDVATGDVIKLCVLDTVYVYTVSDTEVVTPEAVSGYMNAKEGPAQITLVTCTPIGINSHRLIVTGTFVKTEKAEDTEGGWNDKK